MSATAVSAPARQPLFSSATAVTAFAAVAAAADLPMTDLQPLNGAAEEEGVSATGSGKVESDVESSSERDTRTTFCPVAQLRSLDMVSATAVGLHAGTADAPLR